MKLKGVRLVCQYAAKAAEIDKNQELIEFIKKVEFQVRSIEHFLGMYMRQNNVKLEENYDKTSNPKIQVD